MRSRRVRVVCILLFIGLLLLLCGYLFSAKAGQEKRIMSSDQEFTSEYIQALEQLAKKHDLTMDEVRRKAMLVHFGGVLFPAGSKVISSTLYVVDGPRNALVLGGTDWTGGSKDQSELLVIVDGKVLSTVNLPQRDARQGTTILLFSPDRIDYFDWTGLRGGFFPR
jgi:hypothetical protein